MEETGWARESLTDDLEGKVRVQAPGLILGVAGVAAGVGDLAAADAQLPALPAQLDPGRRPQLFAVLPPRHLEHVHLSVIVGAEEGEGWTSGLGTPMTGQTMVTVWSVMSLGAWSSCSVM